MSNKQLKCHSFAFAQTSWRDSNDKDNPCVDRFSSTLHRSDDYDLKLSQSGSVPAANASHVAHLNFPDMRAAVPATDCVPISTATTLSLQLSRNGRAEPKPKRLRRFGS
jgi:hypothetical protein